MLSRFLELPSGQREKLTLAIQNGFNCVEVAVKNLSGEMEMGARERIAIHSPWCVVHRSIKIIYTSEISALDSVL